MADPQDAALQSVAPQRGRVRVAPSLRADAGGAASRRRRTRRAGERRAAGQAASSGAMRRPSPGAASARCWPLAVMLAVTGLQPRQRVITQEQIDAAVRHSLEKEPLPSPATKAYEAIAPLGGARGRPDGRGRRRQGAARQARDGPQPGHRRGHQGRRHDPDQPARGVGRQARARDLRQRPGIRRRRSSAPSPRTTWRCSRPASLPDDLEPATMRSTGDLAPGRPGHRRRPPLRHRARRSAPAWCRAWAASSARPKASTR